jgi:hypothetical protein
VKHDISYLGPGIHVATLYTVYMIFLNVLIRNRHVMKIRVEYSNRYKFNLIFQYLCDLLPNIKMYLYSDD